MVDRPKGAARVYSGPVIDTHVHLQLDEQMQMVGNAHSPDHYLKAAADIDLRAVGVLVMAPSGELDRTRRQNDLVLELASTDSSPWYAMCSVHPHDGDGALEELERVATAGACGVKLHPNTQDFDVADERVAAVVAKAGELSLPVLFDAYSPYDAGQPGKFVTLATEAEQSKIILAHMHGPRFLELLVYEILGRYPWWRANVWHDVSWAAAAWASSPYAEQFSWVCRKVGVDRLLFGSDFPLDDPVTALQSLDELGFSGEEIASIAHDNAASLFGLDGKSTP
ncbi:MAG: amidohydrolase family protein [Nocardioidaceae bacterium]